MTPVKSTFTIFTDAIIQFIWGGGRGGGLFALKQWMSSSLKQDTLPRVTDLYCVYAKNTPKRNALSEWESSVFKVK